MTAWRQLVGGLLFVAALAALVRVTGVGVVGRVAGVLAAFALAGVGVGVLRSRDWALGAAFFLGICWFWAVVALRVQGILHGAEIAVWIAWAALVLTGSVMARPPRRFEPPGPALGEDRDDA